MHLLPHDILRVLLMLATLLLTFVGAGLYLRGFYLYFATVRWLHQSAQAELRRRYRSSALAVLLKEPSLASVKTSLFLSLLGLPLFALGGIAFNALKP